MFGALVAPERRRLGWWLVDLDITVAIYVL